jgi:hypothetical protein
MTIQPHPFQKSDRRKKLEYVLAAFGMLELIPLIFKTANDMNRDIATQVLTDTELFDMKDWVAQPDACEWCQDMAANGPYPIDFEMDAHPNCRCEWWPTQG